MAVLSLLGALMCSSAADNIPPVPRAGSYTSRIVPGLVNSSRSLTSSRSTMSPLDAERARARAQGPADGRGGGPPAGLLPARPEHGLAPGGRPAAAALAQALGPYGRERARRPGLHGLPGAAPRQAPLDQPLGAPQQGGEAPGGRGRHPP